MTMMLGWAAPPQASEREQAAPNRDGWPQGSAGGALALHGVRRFQRVLAPAGELVEVLAHALAHAVAARDARAIGLGVRRAGLPQSAVAVAAHLLLRLRRRLRLHLGQGRARAGEPQ